MTPPTPTVFFSQTLLKLLKESVHTGLRTSLSHYVSHIGSYATAGTFSLVAESCIKLSPLFALPLPYTLVLTWVVRLVPSFSVLQWTHGTITSTKFRES